MVREQQPDDPEKLIASAPTAVNREDVCSASPEFFANRRHFDKASFKRVYTLTQLDGHLVRHDLMRRRSWRRTRRKTPSGVGATAQSSKPPALGYAASYATAPATHTASTTPSADTSVNSTPSSPSHQHPQMDYHPIPHGGRRASSLRSHL